MEVWWGQSGEGTRGVQCGAGYVETLAAFVGVDSCTFGMAVIETLCEGFRVNGS
jgi:hypothetical protein